MNISKYNEKLEIELKENYNLMREILCDIGHKLFICKCYLEANLNISIETESIYNAFLYLYSRTSDFYRISDLKEIDVDEIYNVIIDILGFKPLPRTGEELSESEYLKECIKDNKEYFSKLNLELNPRTSIQMVLHVSDNNRSDEEKVNIVVIALYCFLEFIIKMFILLRNKHLITENHEFNKKQNELYDEYRDEYYIKKDLYPIYEKEYLDLFPEIYTSDELFLLICMINREEVDNHITDSIINYFKNFYNEDLNEIINRGLEAEDFISIANRLILDEFISWKNEINVGSPSTINLIYSSLLQTIEKDLTSRKLFETIIEIQKIRARHSKQIEELIKLNKNKKLTDVTNDMNAIKQVLEFNLITYEGDYVKCFKKIFSWMGYSIEDYKEYTNEIYFLLKKDEVKTFVIVKLTSKPIKSEVIEEIMECMHKDNTDFGLVVTNNYFSEAAKKLAKENNIILWNKDKIIENIYECKEKIMKF